MKKFNLAAIILCLTVAFSSITVSAAEITATISNQNFFVGGQSVKLTAYLINGNNYIRLRDVGKAVDFSVFYDASLGNVLVDSSRKYVEPLNSVPPTITQTANAALSNQPIYVNGQLVEMTAYNINDNNYVKLRDIGQVLNFSVTYVAQTDSVYMDKSLPYGEEITDIPQSAPVSKGIIADGSGKVSSTPFAEKVLDGRELSREDFSQQANQAIFDDVYTRGAYNAVRQTIIDRDIILQGNNENGFNPCYSYANFISYRETPQSNGKTHEVLNRMFPSTNSYYQYWFGVEPYVKEYYNYPGYSIVTVKVNDFLKPANDATDAYFTELNKLQSDREKVISMNAYLASKLTYKDVRETAALNEMFSSDVQLYGICATYAGSFLYLCTRANIPCIVVSGDDHAWNTVYVDGKWLYVDVTNNDIGDNGKSLTACLLAENYTAATDSQQKTTQYIKEILVPGSTK